MFTGIIETTGKVTRIAKARRAVRFVIRPKKQLRRVQIGESICVNGVCLTVVHKSPVSISFDVIRETFRKSNFIQIEIGDEVNLERALKLGDRLSGHYVMGHIEGTGKITRINKTKKEVEFQVTYPTKLRRYFIPKGCIAMDGISLTIGEVRKTSFSIYLIPHTLKMTNLKSQKVGDLINLETDIFLKTKKSRKK